ncbi:thioesterase [Rhodobacteraceae bacterium WD3A24]|nr:thioesterase [Rhodobacteraceae bacterium WD3A24]
MTDQYIARGPGDLPDRATLASMSGREFMDAMLAGRVARPTISGLLNYRLHSVEDGVVAFRGTPGFEHTNPVGAVHGGWYGTLLDSAMGCAVMTRVPRGFWYTTLEYKINITRALALGTEIEARAEVQHSGRSTVVAAAELRGVEDGRLYATGSTTCLVMAL